MIKIKELMWREINSIWRFVDLLKKNVSITFIHFYFWAEKNIHLQHLFPVKLQLGTYLLYKSRTVIKWTMWSLTYVYVTSIHRFFKWAQFIYLVTISPPKRLFLLTTLKSRCYYYIGTSNFFSKSSSILSERHYTLIQSI